MQPTDDLPENYYLTNFQQIADHCQQQYADLLPPDATAQLQRLRALPDSPQQLFVRLACRKGPDFRADKLNYPEIPDLSSAAARLEEAGLLSLNPALKPSELYSLLTVPELRTLLPTGKGRRQQLLDQLLATHTDDKPLTEYSWPIWRLNHPELIQLLTLLYFGNLHQDLSEFVLRDLGRSRYEPYPLSIEHRLFTGYQQIDNLLALEAWLIRIAEGEELPGTETFQQLLQPVPLLDSHHKRLYRLSYLLERTGRHDDALAGYRHSGQPPARERQARIQANRNPADALQLCREIASDPLDITEQTFCERFIPKLERMLGVPPASRPGNPWPTTSLTLINDGQRVEQQVLSHYSSEGWQGYWCENDLICGLFGLLFWQQIFADLPGAFNQPFQRGPMDLNSSAFYRRRRNLFEARFEALEQHNLLEEVQNIWRQKHLIANPFVRWKKLELSMLEKALRLISRSQLLAMLRKIAFDNHHFRSGLPDLFIWRDSEWKLVEVKGPGDQLQESQKRWLAQFRQHNIPVEVCYVAWQDI